MKLLHTMIRVKDIKKSLNFYEELLEMKLRKEMRLEEATLYFLSDKEGYTEIELTYNDKTPPNGYEVGKGFGHLAFEVESLDAFTKRLHDFGCEYLYEPFNLSGHNFKIAFIRDPDGYEIELIEKH